MESNSTSTSIRGRLKSRELEENICRMIATEGLESGEAILSEHNLAKRYGVSRVTVRRAIAELVKRNILARVKGKGTFVRDAGSVNKSRSVRVSTKTVGLVVPTINKS